MGQEVIKHQFTSYQAPDGKLYVQKSLPLYLYLSTKPNAKGELHQLQSDSTKAYSNPMYLDTEGYNTVRSPSCVDTVTKQLHYPLHDVVFEVYADSRAPHSSLTYDAKKKFYNGKELFVGSDVEIVINSNDVHSGVNTIYVSVDSGTFVKYNQPIKLTQQKTYNFQFYGVDNVGNGENVKSKTFIVDLHAPKTELSFEGDKFEDNISGRTELVLSAEDNISGIKAIYYSIDDKQERRYYTPIKSAYLNEGEHNIKYYSLDKVGNKENEHSYTFYVDKTPPILVDEIMGNSFVMQGREYSSGRTKLKLTAVDNKAGVKEIKYNINNEGYMVYEKPFYLSAISGSLSVVSYAEDQVGNRSMANEKSTKNRASYVDLTGPTLKYDFIGKVFKTRDTTFINKNTKIKLWGTDNEAGLKTLTYAINGAEEKDYKEPISIEQEDKYTLNVYGYDNVDNSNRIAANLYVDNTGPDIYSRFSILPVSKKKINGFEADVYSSHVVLFLSATDSRVAIDRIYYSLNGGTEKMYTGIISGFKRGVDYTVHVKAYDKLGNLKEADIVFATDNTGPEVFARFSVHPVGKLQVEGKELEVYPSHVSIFLSVTNAHVAYDKIFYSINGGIERLYNGIIEGFKQGADITMHIRALDQLGNQTKKDIHFMIEK
jgi:hypothetical protein